MLRDTQHHHFVDISGINYKDIEISFSVQHLLANDDYLMLHQPPQKQPKNKNKKGINAKKEQATQSKKGIRQADKNRKRSVLGSLRSKDCCQEKDTQDDSETVKIYQKPVSSKLTTPRKVNRIQSKLAEGQVQSASNKIQPGLKERSRTKSTSQLAPIQRKTQAAVVSPFKTPIRIENSLRTSNSKSQLSKARSQTIKGNNQDLKMKNENIVRNDYFQEKQKIDEEVCHQVTQNGKLNKKRSVSGLKRLQLANKKLKRVLNIQQKAGLRSPKAIKK